MQLSLLTHTERKTITIRCLSVVQREKDNNYMVFNNAARPVDTHTEKDDNYKVFSVVQLALLTYTEKYDHNNNNKVIAYSAEKDDNYKMIAYSAVRADTTERQTDRDTDRQTETERDRQTETETDEEDLSMFRPMPVKGCRWMA